VSQNCCSKRQRGARDVRRCSGSLEELRVTLEWLWQGVTTTFGVVGLVADKVVADA